MALSEDDVDADPFVQLARWYDDARRVAGDHADDMVVATATPDGEPSARMVLLRGLDERGLCFYTNIESHKGRDLAANARAALVLHWPDLGRQVRVTGAVSRLDEADAIAYWRNRPRASQLSAWASRQSEPVASRAELEAEVERVAARFGDGDVPLPPVWGGYRVEPDAIELWEHRDDRLHDRLRYRRDAAGAWLLERLAPRGRRSGTDRRFRARVDRRSVRDGVSLGAPTLFSRTRHARTLPAARPRQASITLVNDRDVRES